MQKRDRITIMAQILDGLRTRPMRYTRIIYQNNLPCSTGGKYLQRLMDNKLVERDMRKDDDQRTRRYRITQRGRDALTIALELHSMLGATLYDDDSN